MTLPLPADPIPAPAAAAAADERRISPIEWAGLCVGAVSAVGLAAFGTASSYSTVADVAACVEYHQYERIASKKKEAGEQLRPQGASAVPEGKAARGQHDAKGDREADAKRLGCDAPDMSDDAAIGIAGLWIACYGFACALIFGAIAVLTFYVGFIESRRR